ncbi:MAG: hypothetical protein U0166_03720 [Acidobacteriota bacterium]
MAKVSFFAYQTLKYGVNVAAGITTAMRSRRSRPPGPGAACSAPSPWPSTTTLPASRRSRFNAFMFAATRYGLDLATGSSRATPDATSPRPRVRTRRERGHPRRQLLRSSIVVIPALDGVIAVPRRFTAPRSRDLGL